MAGTRDEFYLFTMPGDMCPVWCEMFSANGMHTVAPMPVDTMDAALASLQRIYPGTTIDTLCEPADIGQCREWARTMPLEQIGAGQ
jgi:hypothetical protein